MCGHGHVPLLPGLLFSLELIMVLVFVVVVCLLLAVPHCFLWCLMNFSHICSRLLSPFRHMGVLIFLRCFIFRGNLLLEPSCLLCSALVGLWASRPSRGVAPHSLPGGSLDPLSLAGSLMSETLCYPLFWFISLFCYNTSFSKARKCSWEVSFWKTFTSEKENV